MIIEGLGLGFAFLSVCFTHERILFSYLEIMSHTHTFLFIRILSPLHKNIKIKYKILFLLPTGYNKQTYVLTHSIQTYVPINTNYNWY